MPRRGVRRLAVRTPRPEEPPVRRAAQQAQRAAGTQRGVLRVRPAEGRAQLVAPRARRVAPRARRVAPRARPAAARARTRAHRTPAMDTDSVPSSRAPRPALATKDSIPRTAP